MRNKKYCKNKFIIFIISFMKEETKKEKFKRLAEARTTRVLDTLDLIGNLSNTSFYEYDDNQVKAIFDSIQSALNENKAKFRKTKKEKGRRFVL